jgi:GNAT superfamily N-acetyltransferase
LLQKFARHEALTGKGLGPHLLLDALSRAVSAGEIVAARYIVVDAIDDNALTFYQGHGFTPLPPPSTMRLVMKCSDAAASLKDGGRRAS